MFFRSVALLLSLLSITVSAQPVLRREIENRLRHMHAAVRAGNVDDVIRHQRHLLQHIRRNPDLLWQSFNPGGHREKKLIDCIAPFDEALFASRCRGHPWDQVIEHVRDSTLGCTLSNSFSRCLLLSKRSILEPRQCQSYLRQLIKAQESDLPHGTLQAKLKIQLAVEYLGIAARYDAFTQVAPKPIPDALLNLIAAFCFGATPQTRAQTKKEVAHMESRKRLRWHEFVLFTKKCTQEFVDYAHRESPFPLSQDKKILRAFVWAGLTEKDLFAQLTRPLKQSLDEYCSEEDRSFRKTLQSKQQTFLGQWPQLVQAINDARLSFEENIDELPDIIPACNAPVHTSS